MATERTPPKKRIDRAESAKIEWKMKAIERREEAEQLKVIATRSKERENKLEEEIRKLKQELNNTKGTVEKLVNENEQLKKKLLR